MVTADAENSIAVGKVICASPVVRHLSFTGSTEVGRILMAQSAPTVKKLSLELGGNAPFLVFDDADIDSAVEGAFASKYRNAGQTCVCSNRIYVQSGVYEEFVEKFAAKVKTAKVGNGFDAKVNQGPLIEEAALVKVERHVADALAKGARLLVGGKRLSQLGSGQFEGFTGQLFGHAYDFVEHLSGLDLGHVVLWVTFTVTHTHFSRLGGNRLVREHANPDTTTTLDVTRNRTACGFDLTGRQTATVCGLQAEVTERHRVATGSDAGVAAFLFLAELSASRLQHVITPY
jgi:hypothetical protein